MQYGIEVVQKKYVVDEQTTVLKFYELLRNKDSVINTN